MPRATIRVGGRTVRPIRTATPGGGGSPGSGDGSQPLLAQADFTYLGYYNVPIDLGTGGSFNYAYGFTHRYVGGQLRFLTTTFANAWGDAYSTTRRLVEFAKPASYGSAVSGYTGYWPDFAPGTGYAPGASDKCGIGWDEANGVLWHSRAYDYSGDTLNGDPQVITARALNSNGTVSGQRGLFGMAGISNRWIMGKVLDTPAWFRTAYGVGAKSIGFGGSAAQASTGQGGISCGPTLFTFPDPIAGGYADGKQFAAGSEFHTLMNCAPFQNLDWYRDGASAPTSFDRGVRNTDVSNYLDNGGSAPIDGNGLPTAPPPAESYWVSPGPDGLGRWTWLCSNYDTGFWVNGPNKQGFVTVPSLSSGKVYYYSSVAHKERTTYEFQVFDPAHLGQVKLGTRAPWAVKPAARWVIQPPALHNANPDTAFENGWGANVVGSSFDATTNTVYLLGAFLSDGDISRVRIYAYSVNC